MSTPIQTLNSTTRKQHDPEYRTTQKDDVTTNEVTQSWRINPDGTPNTPLINQYNADAEALRQQYHIDPTTGEPDHKYLSDILGINPDKLRQQRESEQELNRRKQKEAAWYNALSVLGDMITTAGGGNVWKRDPDNKAKEAAERNLVLQKEQQAEDAAVAQTRAGIEQAFYKALQGLQDSYNKAYNWRTKTQSGGGSQMVIQRGKETTNTSRQAFDNQAAIAARATANRDGNSQWIMNVNITNPDGTVSKEGYQLEQNEFKAVAGLLKAHYDIILHNGGEKAKTLQRQLIANGVLKAVTDASTGKVQYVYDENQLLQNGKFWELDDALRKRIRAVSGNKVKFEIGWGNVSQEQEYDY